MVQLKVLSGRAAGITFAAQSFPVWIGRASASHIRLEDEGVWDQHLLLELRTEEGFILTAQANALTSVNDQPIRCAVLRNGDTIQIGAVKMQFWLDESFQRGLGLREGFTWAAIAALCLGQIALIYWLLQ